MEQESIFVKSGIRLCFISFNFSPVVGGAEIQTERQARQQQVLGNKPIIVTLRLDKHWQRKEILNGLPVVRVGGVYTFDGHLRTGKLGHLPIDIAMFLTLWRLRHRYDVIHVAQMSPSAVVAALIGKLTQKPVIISIQSTGPGETQRRQLEQGAMLMVDTLTDTSFLKLGFRDWAASGEGDITALARLSLGGSAMLTFLRNSNVCFHVTSTRCHSYLTSHGFRAEQIIHISPGIDTEKFQPISNRGHDPTQPERDIICVARLDYAKGIDVLLHAWGRVMHTPAEFLVDLKPRLRLVGDGLLRLQLERIVAELGLQDSVEFLGLRTDIVDLLQHSWGFVLPSRWEGLSNALLEAMACGLPCVATRVSGSEDIIADGINGLLVEPEEPVEMAQALCRILADADFAHRIGQAGRSTAVRDYQLLHFAQRFQELYQRLLAKK
jgi:glycosyltransferase involved in cell wall biosynthesis